MSDSNDKSGEAIGMGCGFITMGIIWAYFKGKEN